MEGSTCRPASFRAQAFWSAKFFHQYSVLNLPERLLLHIGGLECILIEADEENYCDSSSCLWYPSLLLASPPEYDRLIHAFQGSGVISYCFTDFHHRGLILTLSLNKKAGANNSPLRRWCLGVSLISTQRQTHFP